MSPFTGGSTKWNCSWDNFGYHINKRESSHFSQQRSQRCFENCEVVHQQNGRWLQGLHILESFKIVWWMHVYDQDQIQLLACDSFPFILFSHYSFLRKMISVNHMDVCFVALCRSLAMSREATIFAGIYSSFFFHSKVFEDLLKNQVQMKFVLFAAQWLLQLLF